MDTVPQERSPVPMPNFLIVGAAKCGTSSLYRYLRSHPEIYMSPVKEPKFFLFEAEKLSGGAHQTPEAYKFYTSLLAKKDSISDLRAYQGLFSGVAQQKAIGEASPNYIYHPAAAGCIHAWLPHVRLVAILRQPVERAYSHYTSRLRDGLETCPDFEAVLRREPIDSPNIWVGASWPYLRRGFYCRQLQRYYAAFPADQIRVYLYEDLLNGPLGVLQELFRFLGVDDGYRPDMTVKYNLSGVPKNRLLNYLLHRFKPRLALKSLLPERLRDRLLKALVPLAVEKKPLPPEVRSRWTPLFREDILDLQNLIHRDLTSWLNV